MQVHGGEDALGGIVEMAGYDHDFFKDESQKGVEEVDEDGEDILHQLSQGI